MKTLARISLSLVLGLGLCLCLPAAADDLLALDKAGGRLHVIDLDSFTLRHTIAVGHAPHEVIASEDGGSAFVALYGDAQVVGHELVEVDLARGEVTRRIDTHPLLRPHGLARAGANIYFTAELNRALGRFNPAEGRVDRVHGMGGNLAHMVEIAADGQQLFTADLLSGTVSRLDFRAQQPFPTLRMYVVGDKPEGLALDPKGREAWVGLNGEGKIAVLDLERGEVVARLPAGSYPARVELSQDGSLAFAIDPKASQLLVFDVARRERLHAHSIPGVPLGILPGKRTNEVYLTLVEAGEVVEVDALSGEVRRRVDVGQVADGIARATRR